MRKRPIIKCEVIMYSAHTLMTKLITICFFILAAGGCSLCNQKIFKETVLNKADRNHYKFINGVNYYYEEFDSDGTVVFLLHGFSSSTYSWVNVIPQLVKQGYHVYALDMKGFGWSDKPIYTSYSSFELAEEVNCFMEKMKLSNVVFAGNSLGGLIASRIASIYPDKIDKMVLIDAAGYPMELPMIFKMLRMPFSQNIGPVIFNKWILKYFLSTAYYDKKKLSKKNIDAYYLRLCTENAVSAQIKIANSVSDVNKAFEEHANRMKNVKTNTLIIHGENDSWVPLDVSYNYRRNLENSIFYKIPECGHVPQEERPDLIAKLIIDFIEGNKIEESSME